MKMDCLMTQVVQARASAPSPATTVAAGAPPTEGNFAAQPETATAVVAGPAPRRTSGDPFSFDEEPEPIAVAPARPKKKGKGLWIAASLCVALSAIAVCVVVFAGPQLAALFQGK